LLQPAERPLPQAKGKILVFTMNLVQLFNTFVRRRFPASDLATLLLTTLFMLTFVLSLSLYFIYATESNARVVPVSSTHDIHMLQRDPSFKYKSEQSGQDAIDSLENKTPLQKSEFYY
jgi:hypothetical protein